MMDFISSLVKGLEFISSLVKGFATVEFVSSPDKGST